MDGTPALLSLKLAQAAKTGKYASGRITYRVLADTERTQIFLSLVGNEGGGWFSSEIVPFARIEDVLASAADPSLPVLAKQFRQAFVSRSANNAGFLVAVLRAEGLLGPAPETANQQIRTGDWDAWKAGMLSEPGEPYQPMPKVGREKHRCAEPSRANNLRSNTKRGSKAKSNSTEDDEAQEEGSDESSS